VKQKSLSITFHNTVKEAKDRLYCTGTKLIHQYQWHMPKEAKHLPPIPTELLRRYRKLQKLEVVFNAAYEELNTFLKTTYMRDPPTEHRPFQYALEGYLQRVTLNDLRPAPLEAKATAILTKGLEALKQLDVLVGAKLQALSSSVEKQALFGKGVEEALAIETLATNNLQRVLAGKEPL